MGKFKEINGECYEIVEKYEQIELLNLKNKLIELMNTINYVENYDYIVGTTKDKVYLTLINDELLNIIWNIFDECINSREDKILEFEYE